MGLGLAAIKLNLELWRGGIFKGINSVVEMGSQELCLTLADLEEMVRTTGIAGYKKENFAALEKWPGVYCCSSRPFYEMLGIQKYSCVDLNKTYGAIPLDLNYPMEDKSLYGKYDLVTDYGTNEHIFNTSEAFRTMHRLCKTGGILIIGQVAYRGNGYYAYDPSFFEGMAAANSYRILFSSYVIATTTPTSTGSSNQFHVPLSWELIDTFDWTKIAQLGIFYVMQKQSESDFCNPYQNRYLSTIQRNYGYKLQYLQSPPSRSYIPIHSLDSIPGRLLLPEFCRRVYKKLNSSLFLGSRHVTRSE